MEARRAWSSDAEPLMLPLHDHPTAIMPVFSQKWQWDVATEATPGCRNSRRRRLCYAHAVRSVRPIEDCGSLGKDSSPRLRWPVPTVQSGRPLSHCSTNSTVPYKACTGSSSSSSHHPSSFRVLQRWWPAVAAVGSSPWAAAGAGSSRPGEAPESPAGAEGSTGSAGGSSWPCWMLAARQLSS